LYFSGVEVLHAVEDTLEDHGLDILFREMGAGRFVGGAPDFFR
tara:strand:- start:592 stop:720 length:129 start_codon:yes stop_codon:yes gene_type:complete